jgi:glycosyltransferase domain-containing protein
MNPRLTIVMPLKGRHLFTFRYLWHANELRLPYRFLLADGLVHDKVSRLLEDSRSIFPHLDIEYVRYPDDTDYSRFWVKMVDAYARVRTPYVMNMDNDDFAGRWSIERALDFLDANPDFICARGRSVDFSVLSWSGGGYGSLCGKFNRLATNHYYKDVTAATPAERLREGGLLHAVYSAVFRTEAASLIWKEIADINFSDLMLQENFVALRTLTLGKVHIDKRSVSKYSQIDTGISHQLARNWGSHLVRSRFTSDAHTMIERVASAAAEADGADAAQVAEEVRSILEPYYQRYLFALYGLPARIKDTLKRKWPRLATYMRTRPNFSAGRERAAVLAQLKKVGASSDDINRVREELAAVERTLSPEALHEYAGPLLPLVKAHGGREWLNI